MRPEEQAIALLRHPASAEVAGGVWVTSASTDTGGLLLHYRVRGETLIVPAAAPDTARPVDGLWRHSCCEAFVAAAGQTGYREFNFSPSGAWAAYTFSAPRVRVDGESCPGRPEIRVETSGDGFDLHAALPATWLPAGPREFDLGLCAVLEHRRPGGAPLLTYWALTHLTAAPDFHQAASFLRRVRRRSTP